MRQQSGSINGFVPKRRRTHPSRQLQAPTGELPTVAKRHVAATQSVVHPTSISHSTASKPDSPLATEISASLQSLDPSNESLKPSKKSKKSKKPWSKRRKIITWSIVGLLALVVGIGGFIAYKALSAGSSILQGSIFDIIQNQPLKQDTNGRSNILILGTSEDDPGHSGANLTDSMMIMSIDQNKKQVDMFSIPRDLYVKYGMACNSGYEGKINEYYSCSNDGTDSASEQDRLAKTSKFIGDIFGIDIQYAVHVNNTVIKTAVDAVGGVDVDIEGDGPVPVGVQPGSILDRNFDWRCNYTCYYVKYSPGVHHLDGAHALFLAEARGDSAPTYGLINSNPDREINQQKIIVALKQKAVSTGTLANPTKVMSLIDALGGNLRTNFQTKELQTLIKLGSDIKPEAINRVSLDSGDTPYFKSANYNGSSVVIPTAGAFDYSQIQAVVKQKLSSDPAVREGANIAVFNGTGIAGVAQTQASKLTDQNFTVTDIDNAPTGTYDSVEIYQIGNGMSATRAKLESEFKVQTKTTTPPVTVPDGTNFVIIFGKDPAGASTNSN